MVLFLLWVWVEKLIVLGDVIWRFEVGGVIAGLVEGKGGLGEIKEIVCGVDFGGVVCWDESIVVIDFFKFWWEESIWFVVLVSVSGLVWIMVGSRVCGDVVWCVEGVSW